jgi:hypothetical protein
MRKKKTLCVEIIARHYASEIHNVEIIARYHVSVMQKHLPKKTTEFTPHDTCSKMGYTITSQQASPHK